MKILLMFLVMIFGCVTDSVNESQEESLLDVENSSSEEEENSIFGCGIGEWTGWNCEYCIDWETPTHSGTTCWLW